MSEEREARRNRVTVVMGEALKNEVSYYAKSEDRSISDFIRLVLKDWVETMKERDSMKEELE